MKLRLAAIALLLATLAMGLYGIHRSLWLDETWVANSVLAPNLSGMFYYPDWLQTTPPAFLLLVRGAIRIFGLSNASLRIVPLALTLMAVAALIAVGARLLPAAFAVLAGALMAFHPTVIEYSHTLKQYTGEMAMSALILLVAILYLQDPSRRRFIWLTLAFALALPLDYAAVFLLPGIALAVYPNGGMRRAAALLLSSGAMLALLYVFFIRPNLAPVLRAFWTQNAQGLTPGLLAALLFSIAAIAFVRSWTIAIVLLPCLLLAAANALHWYPNSARTRLFVLPCFFLGVMIAAEKLLGRRRLVTAGAWIVALLFVGNAAWKQVHAHRDRPVEDFAGAVAYLREHVMPADLVLVHASVKEGFKLYERMGGWNRPPAIFGDTGYPCCRRAPQTTTNPAADLDRKIPAAFHGRIWLFYSTRPSHWAYVGSDEGQLWIRYVQAKGCAPVRYLTWPNLAVAEVNCPRQ